MVYPRVCLPSSSSVDELTIREQVPELMLKINHIYNKQLNRNANSSDHDQYGNLHLETARYQCLVFYRPAGARSAYSA